MFNRIPGKQTRRPNPEDDEIQQVSGNSQSLVSRLSQLTPVRQPSKL